MEKNQFGKLILESKYCQYRIYIEIDHGADIPSNLRDMIVSLARDESRNLTEEEIRVIESIFEQDITELKEWERIEVKKALTQSQIGIKIKAGPQLKFNGIFQLPKEFMDFTGRKAKIAELENNLQRPRVITQKLAGTGGIGKTQLASYYTRLKLIEGYYKWVVWFRVGQIGEDQGLQAQFIDLGSRLGIDIKVNQEDRLVELVYSLLSKRGKGLVVIDDVVDYTRIKGYLPNRYDLKSIDVLMTSQDARSWGPEIEKVYVGMLEPEEALKYIEKTIDHRKFIDVEARELARELGYYPLALTQAIAYINNRPVTISGYIYEFKRSKVSQKVLLDSLPFADDDHQKTVYVTIKLSFSKITNIDAHQLLNVCSFLAAESPIDVKLLRCYIKDFLKCSQAIDELKQYSLIKDSNDINCVAIHQMVQMIIKILNEDVERKNTLSMVINIMHEYFSSIEITYMDQLKKKKYSLPHLLHLIKSMDQMKMVGILLAHMRFDVGSIYSITGQLKEALSMFEHASTLYTEISTVDCISVARCLVNIGSLKASLDDLEGSNLCIERARSILINTPENVSVELAGCLMTLGNIALSKRDAVNAIRYFTESLSIWPHTHQYKDLDKVGCKVGIGNAYLYQGKTKEAIKIFQETLEQYRDIFSGDDDVNVGRCLGSLGAAFFQDGASNNAIDCFKKSRVILKSHLDRFHPNIAMSYRLSGNVYMSLKNFEKAKHYIKKAIHIFDEMKLNDHIEMVLSKYQLLSISIECNQYSESTFRDLNDYRRKFTTHYGEDSPNVKLVDEQLRNLQRKYLAKKALPIIVFVSILICCNSGLAPAGISFILLVMVMRIYLRVSNSYSLNRSLFITNTHNEAASSARSIKGSEIENENKLVTTAVKGKLSSLSEINYEWLRNSDGLLAIDQIVARKDLNSIEKIKLAVLKHYVNFKISALELYKCVYLCASNDHFQDLEILIHLEVQIDIQCISTGQTALHIAVMKNHIKCVRLLIDAGADPNKEDLKGITPISLAKDKPEIFAILARQENNNHALFERDIEGCIM